MDSFSEGAEREHREEGQRDQDQGDAGDHSDELRSMGGQRADATPACVPCLASEPASAEHQDDRQEPAEHHRQAERGVVPLGVDGDAGERRAVVVGRGGERVQHFRQPVRTGVEHPGPLPGQRHRDRGAGQHEQRRDQEIACGELDLARVDLLAEVLRGAADHQAGDEHRDHREDRACRTGPSRCRRAPPRRAAC